MFGYIKIEVILSLRKCEADASKVLKFKIFVLRTLKLQVRRRELQDGFVWVR